MKQLLQAGGLEEACTVYTLQITKYGQTHLLSSTGGRSWPDWGQWGFQMTWTTDKRPQGRVRMIQNSRKSEKRRKDGWKTREGHVIKIFKQFCFSHSFTCCILPFCSSGVTRRGPFSTGLQLELKDIPYIIRYPHLLLTLLIPDHQSPTTEFLTSPYQQDGVGLATRPSQPSCNIWRERADKHFLSGKRTISSGESQSCTSFPSVRSPQSLSSTLSPSLL